MAEAQTVAPATTKTLQEVIFAAHFRTPLPLGLLDFGAWISSNPDFPIVQELPPLSPVAMPVFGMPQAATFEIGVAPQLPRILLRSQDGRFSLQLQTDRIAFAWSRIEPVGAVADYPGFDRVLETWVDVRSTFEAWATGRFRAKPQYRLVELNYMNAAPLDDGGKKRRISEIFRFVQPGVRPVNMFNVQWGERVYPDDRPGEPAKGMIVCGASLGQAPPATSALIFQFAGMAQVADGQETNHIIKDLHAKIREIYLSAIITDAH